jgi:hypothetical protein
MTLQEIVEQLESCHYECEAGTLENNVAWQELKKVAETPGEISDGYHTFNELYKHRHVLFAHLLFDRYRSAWKTWRNQNGEKWDGWFIAGLNTTRGQISYHLPAEWWATLTIAEIERNADYDGHNSGDVLERLRYLLEED